MSWASWAVIMIAVALTTAAIWRASGGLHWFGLAAGASAMLVAVFAGVSALDLAGGSIERVLDPVDRVILSMLEAFGHGALGLMSAEGASFWLFANAALVLGVMLFGALAKIGRKPRAAGRLFAPQWREREARGRGLIAVLVSANAFLLIAGPSWIAGLVGW